MFGCKDNMINPTGKITQIALPASSGVTPTGAMQFKDDWPGLFIRGDEAISLMVNIRALCAEIEGTEFATNLRVFPALVQLRGLADLIDQDVRMKQDIHE